MNTVAPESVGFSASRLDRIQTVMQSLVDQGRLPGAVTVIARHGQVAHAGCFGMADIEAKKPMQMDALFPIFSMTKPITAAAVMLLYERGCFQLYDPLSKFLPEFKGGKVYIKTSEKGIELEEREREITIYDLLTQTSGLISDLWLDQTLAQIYQESGVQRPDITLQEFSQLIARLPGLHQPGKAWRYGESFDILPHLIEVVSGSPYATFLKQNIFEPLGMPDTGYYGAQEAGERFVKYYAYSPTREFVEAVEPDRLVPSTFAWGGFGLVSTAGDFLKFAQMLLNGGELQGRRLLGPRTVQYMTQNHLPPEMIPIQLTPEVSINGYGYGFGMRVLTDVRRLNGLGSEGEYGWHGYGGTYFWVDPKEDLIGLILMRIEPFSSMQFETMGYFTFIDTFRSLTYQAVVD